MRAAGGDTSSAVRARSHLGLAYDRVYGAIAGQAPHIRFWHFQWLAVAGLYADLRRELNLLDGRVLDVGCGEKPYRPWVRNASAYVGIDISPGPEVDVLIDPDRTWPLESASFDSVLCTQVLEHVADLSLTVDEIARVLKPGGRLVVTIPFAYNEHGAPHDYRRLSRHGLAKIFAPDYETLEIRTQGGVGSTVGTLALNWADASLDRSRATRLLKVGMLPVWIAVCALVNAGGWAVDHVDRTHAFYGNVLLTATRRAD